MPLDRLFTAAILILTGCAAVDAPAAHAGGTPAPLQTLADILVEELPALRSGQTLQEWQRTHPSDSIAPHSPHAAEGTLGDWCVSARSQVALDSSSTVVRIAFFYPPPMPDPPVLSASPVDAEMVSQCRLGFVSVTLHAADTARAAADTREAAAALAAVVGARSSDARVMWWNAAAWEDTHLWKSDASSIALARTAQPAWGQQAADGGNRVLLMAAGPASGIDLEWQRGDSAPDAAWLDEKRHERERLRNAIGLAGAEDELATAFSSAAARFAPEFLYGNRFSDEELTELVDALLRWLRGTADLPLQQRAAALLAADLFMTQYDLVSAMGGDAYAPLRARLQALGGTFTYSPLGQSHIHTRSWLKEARRIAPDSPAGELALLVLMEAGFETALCTDQGGTGFRTVIDEGEAFLRVKPDAAIAADVQLMTAQAYADIVTLAGGGGSGYAEPDDYIPEAAAARAKALTHFREGLARAGNSFMGRQSWPTAWRLQAGLTPMRTFFFCIYD